MDFRRDMVNSELTFLALKYQQEEIRSDIDMIIDELEFTYNFDQSDLYILIENSQDILSLIPNVPLECRELGTDEFHECLRHLLRERMNDRPLEVSRRYYFGTRKRI